MKINKDAVIVKTSKFKELAKELRHGCDSYRSDNVVGMNKTEWDVSEVKDTLIKLLELLDEIIVDE